MNVEVPQLAPLRFVSVAVYMTLAPGRIVWTSVGDSDTAGGTSTHAGDWMPMDAEAEPRLLDASFWAPTTVTRYIPLGADAGAVTCSVVEIVAPALTVRLAEDVRAAVHPAGTLGVRLKLDAPHELLLRLVTATANVTLVPGTIGWAGGADSVTTAGRARTLTPGSMVAEAEPVCSMHRSGRRPR